MISVSHKRTHLIGFTTNRKSKLNSERGSTSTVYKRTLYMSNDMSVTLCLLVNGVDLNLMYLCLIQDVSSSNNMIYCLLNLVDFVCGKIVDCLCVDVTWWLKILLKYAIHRCNVSFIHQTSPKRVPDQTLKKSLLFQI